MNNKLKSVYFFSIIFVILDQVVKIFISGKVALNQTITLIKDFFSITLVHNKGAAFSILSGNKILFIIIGIIALILISVYVSKIEILNDIDVFIYALLMGGILGNLIDRIFYGYVIDFISFNFWGYSFPIFNLADVFIVLSILILIVSSFKEDLCKSQ